MISKNKRNQIVADAAEINRLLNEAGISSPPKRRSGIRAKRPARKPAVPLPTNSNELCKRLVCIAALSLSDSPEAQKMIYLAVRTLQRLDKAAMEAGILPTA